MFNKQISSRSTPTSPTFSRSRVCSPTLIGSGCSSTARDAHLERLSSPKSPPITKDYIRRIKEFIISNSKKPIKLIGLTDHILIEAQIKGPYSINVVENSNEQSFIEFYITRDGISEKLTISQKSDEKRLIVSYGDYPSLTLDTDDLMNQILRGKSTESLILKALNTTPPKSSPSIERNRHSQSQKHANEWNPKPDRRLKYDQERSSSPDSGISLPLSDVDDEECRAKKSRSQSRHSMPFIPNTPAPLDEEYKEKRPQRTSAPPSRLMHSHKMESPPATHGSPSGRSIVRYPKTPSRAERYRVDAERVRDYQSPSPHNSSATWLETPLGSEKTKPKYSQPEEAASASSGGSDETIDERVIKLLVPTVTSPPRETHHVNPKPQTQENKQSVVKGDLRYATQRKTKSSSSEKSSAAPSEVSTPSKVGSRYSPKVYSATSPDRHNTNSTTGRSGNAGRSSTNIHPFSIGDHGKIRPSRNHTLLPSDEALKLVCTIPARI